ncbi:tetratricopeptide repeat protein [Wenyingzhuangia aestuarii]|uniref:tetratricopeptide repeat protein n=1 Tax=Wenyingzhuangia aestuarii TaxID=1647582 RepID=UPI0014395B15|nr:hypothetical protein [Wenyingzhuangia aestuarii]NJB82148.1 DNA-binding CsgD family transcriptional regulator [Wenyingzhuangia aestuarii]
MLNSLRFLVVGCWLISSSVLAQNSLQKSIEQDLQKAKDLTTHAYYPEAYDKLWNVLILSDSLHNSKIKYKAYKNLSQLYSIFHEKEKAFMAIDSMFVYAKQQKVFTNPKVKSNLYYTAALTYRMNDEYDVATKYLAISEHILDSLHSSFNDKLYVLTEKAHLYTLTKNYSASEKLLTEIVQKVSKQHHYASIINSMLGDLYAQKGENKKALTYYNRSLEILSKKKNRVGLKVGLLEKTAKINGKLGMYKIAFQQMTSSKVLGDSLFGGQSERNKELFEIKDSYRTAILQNKRIQKEQELKLIKTQKEKLNIQLIFSTILFILTVIVSFFGMKLIRKKHATEKKLARERARAEVEIKEKELAVTALQLMQKDKLLEEIKKGLENVKKDKDDVSVEQIKSTIKVNATKTWEEFETRFVQVNSSFYESLSHKHPNLSRNELKLCALIKLNFSTKEMAQLLGVSADSINKARYRLRKKLALNRDDNLVAYINSI